MMRVRSAVKKIVAPLLEKECFTIRNAAAGSVEFSDNKDRIRINIEYNRRSDSLSVHCFYRNRRNFFSSFDLQHLTNEVCNMLYYSSQQELNTKLGTITDILLDKAVPFLHHIYVQQVSVDDSKYIELIYDPELQAKRFAKQHYLSLKYNYENVVYLEKYLDDMRGNDLNERKVRFIQHIDSIAELMSYYGELLKDFERVPMQWRRYTTGHYALQAVDQNGWSSPVDEVIYYWDRNPFISNATLIKKYPTKL